jgi:hypothetical protein
MEDTTFADKESVDKKPAHNAKVLDSPSLLAAVRQVADTVRPRRLGPVAEPVSKPEAAA